MSIVNDPLAQPNTIALSLSGLPEVSAPTLRSVVDRVAAMGCRGLSLSCNAPGLKPRALGRSARRDLAAALRRADLACSGVDLFIPPKHLGDPARSDRATEAYLEAIAFTADIAELAGAPSVLTTTLARDEASSQAVGAIAERADARNVTIADLAWPPLEDPPPAITPGFDPASVLRVSPDDAPTLAARYAKRLGTARISDADDAGRCPLGDGHLDTLAYLLSLFSGGYTGPIVIDTRGLKDPWAGAETALRACAQLPLPGANA